VVKALGCESQSKLVASALVALDFIDIRNESKLGVLLADWAMFHVGNSSCRGQVCQNRNELKHRVDRAGGVSGPAGFVPGDPMELNMARTMKYRTRRPPLKGSFP